MQRFERENTRLANTENDVSLNSEEIRHRSKAVIVGHNAFFEGRMHCQYYQGRVLQKFAFSLALW